MSVARLSPSSAEERIVELEDEVARLTTFVDEVMPALVAIAERVDALPKPRFEIPRGWLTIKAAAIESGWSVPSLYRMARTGKIFAVKVSGRGLVVDPATLPLRK